MPHFRPRSYSEWRGPGLRGLVASLAAGRDFREQHLTQSMDRRLHHHHASGVAVETWTRERTAEDAPPRRWLYNLLPRWTWTPTEDWPLEEPDTITIHTVGKVTPNPGHTWPDPAPFGTSEPTDFLRTHCLTAVTDQPPPPADYSDRSLAPWTTST